jgi:hypothetical protein
VKKSEFKPFKNEADCITIGEDLTIENRLDRINIYGSIDLTKDKMGLELANELKKIIDLTVAELENSALPERITIIEPETVKNPFA